MFILTAFDMARDMLITPRRIEYAKDKESELYESLLNIANRKQDEIRDLIIESISSMREELMQASRDHEFQGWFVTVSTTARWCNEELIRYT